MVRWEDMTIDEQLGAIRHHNKIYGIDDRKDKAP